MHKNQLRKIYSKIRKQYLLSSTNAYHSKLRDNFLRCMNELTANPQIIGSYIPVVGKQIIPPFIEGKKFAYPFFIKENREMQFKLFQPGAKWNTGPYGIIIPHQKSLTVQIDIAMVPMLCFDSRLNRIGYGGGYYDNYIRKSRKNSNKCKFIGISLECLKYQGQIQKNDFDEQLDAIITEENVYIA